MSELKKQPAAARPGDTGRALASARLDAVICAPTSAGGTLAEQLCELTR